MFSRLTQYRSATDGRTDGHLVAECDLFDIDQININTTTVSVTVCPDALVSK